MSTKINKTFIIRHKVTKEQWTAVSGKSQWKQSNHAKSAWANTDHKHTEGIIPLKIRGEHREWFEYPYFNDQDVYECIELKHESEEKLQEALILLIQCEPEINKTHLPSTLLLNVRKFIKENENVHKD